MRLGLDLSSFHLFFTWFVLFFFVCCAKIFRHPPTTHTLLLLFRPVSLFAWVVSASDKNVESHRFKGNHIAYTQCANKPARERERKGIANKHGKIDIRQMATTLPVVVVVPVVAAVGFLVLLVLPSILATRASHPSIQASNSPLPFPSRYLFALSLIFAWLSCRVFWGKWNDIFTRLFVALLFETNWNNKFVCFWLLEFWPSYRISYWNTFKNAFKCLRDTSIR